MNAGLTYLLRMVPTTLGRRLRRQLRGGRAVLLLLLLAFLILPQLMQTSPPGAVAASIDGIRLWAPVGLLLSALLSASSGHAFAFRPQEIDFLFPAPIPRRQLILYKVTTTLAGGTLAAVWVGLIFVRHAPHWAAGIAGTVLAMWFVSLVSMLAGLLTAVVDVRLARWARWSVWIVLGGGVAIGVAVMRWMLPQDAGLRAAVGALVQTWPAQVVTLPCRTFVEVFLAKDWSAFALWSSGALAVLLLLFAVMERLDLSWTEGSVRQSQLALARLRRAASDGMPAAGARLTGLRLPTLPRWGGLGPIVWRQGTEALRNLRSILIAVLVFVGAPAVILLMMREHAGSVLPAIAPFLVITIVSTHLFAFDFRRDLDRMALLKALPLRPVVVAAAQVAVPMVLKTALQVVVLVAVAASTDEIPAAWLAAACAVLPLVNWMAGALDNVMFLLWPHRIVPKSGEPMFGHRAMFGSLLKMVILAPVAGVCAGVVHVVFGLTGSPWWACAGAGFVCALSAVAFTLWLARCFRRYDVATLGSE